MAQKNLQVGSQWRCGFKDYSENYSCKSWKKNTHQYLKYTQTAAEGRKWHTLPPSTFVPPLEYTLLIFFSVYQKKIKRKMFNAWKKVEKNENFTMCFRRLLLPKFNVYYRVNYPLQSSPIRHKEKLFPVWHWKTGLVIALLRRPSWKFNINVFSLPSLYSCRAPVKNCFAVLTIQLNINSNLLGVPLNPLLLPRRSPFKSLWIDSPFKNLHSLWDDAWSVKLTKTEK